MCISMLALSLWAYYGKEHEYKLGYLYKYLQKNDISPQIKYQDLIFLVLIGSRLQYMDACLCT